MSGLSYYDTYLGGSYRQKRAQSLEVTRLVPESWTCHVVTVPLAKSLNHTEPQFPHLRMGIEN